MNFKKQTGFPAFAGNDNVRGYTPKPLICVVLLTISIHADPLTLEQAVDIGLKNNHGIRIARNTDQQAQNNRILGVGGMLPSASLSASLNRTLSDSGLKAPWAVEGESKTVSKSAQALLSWTLFDGFRMFYAYQSLNESADLSSIRKREQIEGTVVSIMQAYFNVVTQTELLKAAELQAEISENRLKRMETRRSLGAGSEVELLNARVAYNTDQSLLQNRTLASIIAENELNLAMGRAHSESLSVEDDLELPEMQENMDEWRKAARENNARKTVLEKTRRLRELDLAMQRSRYWPVITATGSYGLSRIDRDPAGFLSDGDETSLSMGLTATMPLFNGFKTRTSVKKAKLELENAGVSQEQYELRLDALLDQQRETIRNAYRQVEFEKETVSLSEKHLALVQQQFELGRATGVEFREAQLALSNARIRLASSKFQARLATVELERLTGKIRVE